MMKSLTVLGVLVLAAQTTPAMAQQRSAVNDAELRSAVSAAPEADRAAVQQFLQNDRVIEAAKSLGVRSDDLAAKVSRLDNASLSQVAEQTRAANLDLVGGKEYVIISTTAIIIILLILILVT